MAIMSKPSRKYRKNYDKIRFTTSGPISPSGRYVVRNGEMVPVEQAGELSPAKPVGAINHVSEGLGVHPKQTKEMDSFYSLRGIKAKHNPEGNPIFSTRRDYLKALKARGFHNKNEICG